MSRLLTIAEPALRLTVGDAYIGAATVLGWLMARQAILAFGFPLGLALVRLGRATALLKVNLVTSAIYVGLLTASLPLWGLNGAGFAAAAAAVVATSLHAAVVIRTFRRETRPVTA